jgi:hypothetical protein
MWFGVARFSQRSSETQARNTQMLGLLDERVIVPTAQAENDRSHEELKAPDPSLPQ